MRVLDFITTAAAVGVFGYFVWKIILPKLGELELPYWQPPPAAQQQTPQLPSTPSPPTPPAAEQPITDEPETETKKPKEEEKPKSQAPLVPSRSPPAAVSPPVAGGTLLWDSNIHGKWNNGQKRVVTTKEGGQGANGKGIQTAASGDPTLTIDGNGVAHLTSSKFGRIYIYANNYNARLEGQLMFEKINNPEDNISIKLRSRHGHSPNIHPIGGGSECGGVGAAYKGHGGIELQVEGDHDTDGSTDIGTGKGPVPQVGKWYKFAYSVWDAGGVINTRFELDGKVVGQAKGAGPPICRDKTLFDKDSYFWLRLNSKDEVTPIKAAFSNIRLTSLSAGSNLAMTRRSMIDEPWKFNGYYHGRRQ